MRSQDRGRDPQARPLRARPLERRLTGSATVQRGCREFGHARGEVRHRRDRANREAVEDFPVTIVSPDEYRCAAAWVYRAPALPRVEEAILVHLVVPVSRQQHLGPRRTLARVTRIKPDADVPIVALEIPS